MYFYQYLHKNHYCFSFPIIKKLILNHAKIEKIQMRLEAANVIFGKTQIIGLLCGLYYKLRKKYNWIAPIIATLIKRHKNKMYSYTKEKKKCVTLKLTCLDVFT